MSFARSRRARLVELVLVSSSSCSCGHGASWADDELPHSVSVDLLGAVIAPVKADKTPWDGAGNLPGSVGSALADAFEQARPYEAVLSALASLVASAFDKPDPSGTAEPRGTVLPTLRLDSASENTLTPVWRPTPRWRGLPLRPDVQLLVALEDQDVLGSEPIETVSIGHSDLATSLRSGGVYPVDVHKQGRGQLLFVTVLVTPSRSE
ncbi:MAG: hypothetical protein JW940_17880 [Polyangiaceae bacterium]|nr:hypothetical protein [Polyangiaceae bacterium]